MSSVGGWVLQGACRGGWHVSPGLCSWVVALRPCSRASPLRGQPAGRGWHKQACLWRPLLDGRPPKRGARPAWPLAPFRRRRYAHALELLLTAVTAPTMVLNAITVACLKKFMLVSLIHAGSVPQLPKYTAPIVV